MATRGNGVAPIDYIIVKVDELNASVTYCPTGFPERHLLVIRSYTR